jgi:hypothetical protein
MEGALQKVADGSAKGLERAYAVAHAARCVGCGTFLERLKVTIGALRAAREAPAPETIERLRSQIQNLTQGRSE